MICDHANIASHCMECLHKEQERRKDAAPTAPLPADGGMRTAMVKLSRALGHPNPVDAAEGQCVEAALIEMAARRIDGVDVGRAPDGENHG